MALALRFVSQCYSSPAGCLTLCQKTGSGGEVLSIREIPAPLKTPWRKINMKNKVGFNKITRNQEPVQLPPLLPQCLHCWVKWFHCGKPQPGLVAAEKLIIHLTPQLGLTTWSNRPKWGNSIENGVTLFLKCTKSALKGWNLFVLIACKVMCTRNVSLSSPGLKK